MASIFADLQSKCFEKRKVTVHFMDKFLAGIPARGDTLEYWLKSKHMSAEEEAAFRARVQAGQIPEEELQEVKDSSRCIFERDTAGNICIWHGNWKAFLRDIAVAQGLTQKQFSKVKDKQHAGGKHMIQIKLQVFPLHINFTRAGEVIKNPDGEILRVKHIEDKAGKRSALGLYEYVENCDMSFELYYPGEIFTEEEIQKLFAVGEKAGHGASKSQGFGTFETRSWGKI